MKKNLYFLSLLFFSQVAFADDQPLNGESKATTQYTDASLPLTKNASEPENTEDTATYYVLANNGLNYRTKPSGKILGTFPLMTPVNIIERTDVTHTVKDNGNSIKGEWVGVKDKNGKKVYVFDGFLSVKKKPLLRDYHRILSRELLIYNFSSSQDNDKNVAFLTLSDNYPWGSPGRIINDDYLNLKTKNEDYILDKKNRAIFNFRMGIEETDTVYLYNPEQDKVLSYNVKELPLIAEANAYGGDSSESDFLIGFDLSNAIKTKGFLKGYQSFGFIGQDNPFVTGDIKPILWEEADEKSFPIIPPSSEVLNHPYYFKTEDSVEFYRFTHNEYNYFLKIKNKKDMYKQAFRIVVTVKKTSTETMTENANTTTNNPIKNSENSDRNNVVHDHFYHSSEGSTPAPLSFKHNKNNAQIPALNELNQWTGQIFKDKPPILLGFMYYSFSCPIITFLESSERITPILCDPRH